jgi:Ca2+-binding EF-hand superfamily protein
MTNFADHVRFEGFNEEIILDIFDAFRDMWDSQIMSYDELLQELKSPLTTERRSVLRSAFRKMDTGNVGLIDIADLRER